MGRREVRSEGEGDTSWGRASLKGHPVLKMWTSKLRGGLTPWTVFFILELFNINLEIVPGLLKLSTKIILATVWKPLRQVKAHRVFSPGEQVPVTLTVCIVPFT